MLHGSGVSSGSLPPIHPLVLRLGPIEIGEIAREFRVYVAPDLVPCAQRNLLEGVEHVEFGHGEPGEPVDAGCITHNDAVEPSASAGTARSRAELIAQGAHTLAFDLVQLGRKRTVPDSSRVGLHDAQSSMNRGRRDSHSYRRATGGRAARRHVRVRTMVDVEEGALGSLEQYVRTAGDCAVDREAHVFGDRKKSWCEALEQLHGRVHVSPVAHPERGEDGIGVGDPFFNERAKPVCMPEIENPDAAPCDLVFIGGTDAAASRSNLAAGRAERVHELVIRENEMGAITDVEPALHVDAIFDQLVDLGEKRIGVQYDAVSDGTADTAVQDSARDLVEDERFFADVDGVPGIRSALVSHDPVGALSEHVHELALPFIAPLGADDDDSPRFRIEHWGPEKGNAPASRGVGSI